MKRVVGFSKALVQELAKRIIPILFVLGVLLLFQGYQNTQAAKDNARSAKENAQIAKENSEDTRDVIESQNKAVTDLMADNHKQTAILTSQNVIMCKIALGSRLELDEADAAAIERICKEQIKRASEVAQLPTSATTNVSSSSETRPPSQSDTPSQSTGNPGKPTNPSNPGTEQPPEPEPSLLDRAVQGVASLLNNIREAL